MGERMDHCADGFRQAWTWRGVAFSLTIAASSVTVIGGLLLVARAPIESRIEQIAAKAVKEGLEDQKHAIEVQARKVAQQVIEESVPRAHTIAREEAAAAMTEHVSGVHAERLREIERIHAAMIRVEDSLRQVRDDLRQLRSEVKRD